MAMTMNYKNFKAERKNANKAALLRDLINDNIHFAFPIRLESLKRGVNKTTHLELQDINHGDIVPFTMDISDNGDEFKIEVDCPRKEVHTKNFYNIESTNFEVAFYNALAEVEPIREYAEYQPLN